MSTFFFAPVWLLFAALAIPLVFLAASTLLASEIYNATDGEDADVATLQITLNGGSVVQSVQYPGYGSATATTYVGPFGVATNVRSWAAAILICGLTLTAIGIAGLLHFPSHALGGPVPVDLAGEDGGAEQPQN